jgi:hypothetical protein
LLELDPRSAKAVSLKPSEPARHRRTLRSPSASGRPCKSSSPLRTGVIVDKLAVRGLVERTAHPDDNRRKLVKLTAAGREAAALAGQILAEPPPHSWRSHPATWPSSKTC